MRSNARRNWSPEEFELLVSGYIWEGMDEIWMLMQLDRQFPEAKTNTLTSPDSRTYTTNAFDSFTVDLETLTLRSWMVHDR